MFVDDGGELPGDLFDGPFPGYLLKYVTHPFERMHEPIGVVLMIGDIQSLAANVTLATGMVLVAANLDDSIVFNPHFQPAEIRTEDTACFFPIHGSRYLSLMCVYTYFELKKLLSRVNSTTSEKDASSAFSPV